MKIFEVLVDELLQGCQGCCICKSNGDYAGTYHCAAITPDDGRNELGNVFNYMFRRHDCPLREMEEPREGDTCGSSDRC